MPVYHTPHLFQSRETLTWAQAQHLSFGHTHIIFKKLNIEGLINDS
jgi:hypothetical protein